MLIFLMIIFSHVIRVDFLYTIASGAFLLSIVDREGRGGSGFRGVLSN